VGYVQQHAGCTSSAVTTEHTYNSSGNAITGIDPDGHLGCTLAGNTTQYSACATYDGFGTHLTYALNAKNQPVTYRYSTALASTGYGQWLMGTTDANGQTTTYGYDTLGRLTSIVQPGDSQADPTTSYTYINTCTSGATAPCLELDTTTRVTSGSNTATTTKQWYDGMGRLVETQSPGPNQFSKLPAIGSMLVTYTIYDNMGNATTQSLPYAIAASATVHYAIPDLNQARTVSTFDGLGRPLGSVSYGTRSVILSESTISYTVGQGLPSFTADTSTPFEQTITLDAYNHQQVEYTDVLGRDRYEQVFSGTASPYTVVRTVQYNQDEVGNVTSTVTYDATSKAQATHSSIYDGLKRVTGWNDSDQGSCANTPLPTSCSSSSDTAWKMTYDADNNTLSQTDPRNVTTYTSYDALDRPLCRGTASSQVNPCQSSAYATFFYDSYNNSSNPGVAFPSSCIAPVGTSTPIGKTVAETFSNAVGNGWRCSGYDARGQAIANALSVTADGKTTTQNVSTTYNDLGDAISLTYPDGEIVASNYDSNGYFRGMSDANGAIVSAAQYTNAGQLSGMTLGGVIFQGVPTTSVQMNFGYDGIQRPLSTSVSVSGNSIFNQVRSYDNVGNVIGLNTTLPTTSGGSQTDNQSFCYDALNRLVWAGNGGTPSGGDHCGLAPGGTTDPGYQQAFSYDAMDRFIVGPAGTTTYDTLHVHAATSVSSIPNQYASYDAMGNMACRNVDTTTAHSCTTSQTGATMTYDNEGRLVTWKAPSGEIGSDQFLYDNEGNRVLQRTSTTTGGATTVTDTITFNHYTETSITNGKTTTSKYYTADGQFIAMAIGSNWYDLIPDLLGNITLVLNSNGSVKATQLFAPYGVVRYSDGVMPTAYGFTGQQQDVQTGLVYDNFRYYDPISGRFTRTDTVDTNANGSDTYGYVSCNPVTKNDPSGHDSDYDPSDPYIQYVGAWYQMLHPLSRVYVNEFSIPNSKVPDTIPSKWNYDKGNPGNGRPDIVAENGNSGVLVKTLWEVKSSDLDPAKRGTNFASSSTILKGAAQANWYVNRAGREAMNGNANLLGSWQVGSVDNDVSIGIAMRLCGGICTVDFNDGTVMQIMVHTPGVLGYRLVNRPEQPAEEPAVQDIKNKQGQSVSTQIMIGILTGGLLGGLFGGEGGFGPAPAPAPLASVGGCSFTSGTKVGMIVGTKKIGQIKVGNQVLSYNPITHQVEAQSVLYIWRHVDDDLVDVTVLFPSDSHSQQYSMEVLHTTSNHPFLTQERNFLPAGKLTVGLHLLRIDGSVGLVSQVKRIPGTQIMYNLEVAHDHTYTVGVGLWIVHNRLTCM
jgi:RHS repeat-associated protein